MSKNTNGRVNEYQATGLTTWTFSSVRSAIEQLVLGNFQQPTYLSRAMKMDGRYAGCVDKRTLGLVQSPVEVNPGIEGDELAEQAAGLVQEYLERMLPSQELRRLVENFHHLSISPATLDWNYSETVWYPALRTLNPEYTRYDTSNCQWEHQTRDGITVFKPGDGRWVMFDFWRQGMPSGFVSTLGNAWVRLMYARGDAIEWNNKHANPKLLAITPMGAENEDLRSSFVNDIAALQNGGVIECQQDNAGYGYDVKVLPIPTQGHDSIHKEIDDAVNEITTTVLGVNLTTEVVQGSKAAAETHYGVQQELVRADATLLRDVIREQVLRPFIVANLGHGVPIPWVEWKVGGKSFQDTVTEKQVEMQEDDNLQQIKDEPNVVGSNDV